MEPSEVPRGRGVVPRTKPIRSLHPAVTRLSSILETGHILFWGGFFMSKNHRFGTFDIVLLAVLTALTVICGRFIGINTAYFKFETSFIPIMLAAYWYGPAGGAITAALGDFIGAVAFPTGDYFFPFTLSAALGGAIIGFALMGEYKTYKPLLAVIPKQLICSLILNTWFLTILFNKEAIAFFTATRLIQAAVMTVLELLFCYLAIRVVLPKIKSKRLPR